MKISIYSAIGITTVALALASCNNEEPDNYYSLNKSAIEIKASSDYVTLDETAPDDTALVVDWTPAHNFGMDYITTYKYQMQVEGSTAKQIEEYEDDGHYHRAYTNAQLQQLLLQYFGAGTSELKRLNLTVIASFEGKTLVVPDMATVTVKVKTYGPKQFKADRLFMAGTAVGDKDIELERSESDPMIYNYQGKLSAGTIFFPLLYGDDENAIGPSQDGVTPTLTDMDAVVTSRSQGKMWNIPEEDTYRITINLNTHKVKITAVGATVDMDKVALAGSAVPEGVQVELTQALENENVYAWRGTLNAGTLYLPLTYNEQQQMAIVPLQSTNHDIQDGQTVVFGQTATTQAEQTRHWVIPTTGTYRIVMNKAEKTITIYSPATDPQNKSVTWNNTTLKINPYTTVIDHLYMYGTFNAFNHDPGVFTGYEDKYILKQSLANPYIFVYYGDVLPRQSEKDERSTVVTGSVKFTVDNMNNNVFAFGSTADAKRNDHNGYITPALGVTEKLVEGQGDNRYAYFIIPEGCNFVVVDVQKLTVVFGIK